jgi:pimeloyl-ACP methyl ester carboxylesterase
LTRVARIDEPPGRRGKALRLMSPAVRPIYQRFFTGGLVLAAGDGRPTAGSCSGRNTGDGRPTLSGQPGLSNDPAYSSRAHRIAHVDLFVRESGPVGAPAIVFLHGGEYSGRSWRPVVERMQRYRCLVPDLPHHGESSQQLGPFEMAGAATAVAELIRSRVGGRAHVVGNSLGAQVGVQLLATEPKLVDRAVLCGTMINAIPGPRLTAPLLGLIARISRFVTIRTNARHARIPSAKTDDYREDVRLMTGAQIAHLVEASAGFTLPEGLDKSDSATLFLTGSKEMRLIRRSAAALAQRMPKGVGGVAIGMDHDWPLRYPDLFSRTVDGWLSGTALPLEIALPNSGRH